MGNKALIQWAALMLSTVCTAGVSLAAAEQPATEQPATDQQARRAEPAPKPVPPAKPGALSERSLGQLLRWAARLSGRVLPEGLRPPTLISLPPLALQAQVCPERPQDCGSLVAAYSVSDKVILYRDTFDFQVARDRSYIVHELVHFLQHLESGDRVNRSCHTILSRERQAYIAQSKYLSRRGESFPIDEMMKLSFCSAVPSPRPSAS